MTPTVVVVVMDMVVVVVTVGGGLTVTVVVSTWVSERVASDSGVIETKRVEVSVVVSTKVVVDRVDVVVVVVLAVNEEVVVVVVLDTRFWMTTCRAVSTACTFWVVV